MMQNYYIVNTDKEEFNSVVSTLKANQKLWFAQQVDSVRWNDTETKCVLKTIKGLGFIPSFLGTAQPMTREEALVELVAIEWNNEELNLPEGYVDDLTDVV